MRVAGLAEGVHALAQRRRGRHRREAQRITEEGVAAHGLDGVEVGLPGAQQPHIGLDQRTGRNAVLAGNGETRIDDLVDLRKALEVLPHQRQSGVRRQVVGQALDLKVGHGDGGGGKAVIISNARRLHPPGEQKNAGNSCQARVLAVRVTDSGFQLFGMQGYGRGSCV